MSTHTRQPNQVTQATPPSDLSPHPTPGSTPPTTHDPASTLRSEVSAIRDLLDREQNCDLPTGWSAQGSKLIHDLLLPRASRVTLLAALIVIGAATLLNNSYGLLAGLGLLLVGLVIEIVLATLDFIRTMKRRRAETIRNSRAYAERFDQLFYELLPYSRAALLKVADDLTTFDSVVDKRAAAILGQGRGGLLAVLTFGIAGFTALQKVLEGKVISSNLHEPLWWIFIAMLGLALGTVLGRNSVNSATTYAALLRQVASARETMEKEAKETRERQKDGVNSAPSNS